MESLEKYVGQYKVDEMTRIGFSAEDYTFSI